MTPRWLHLYSVGLAVCTVILLCAGALVTSTGSGLAVPDWPLSYGQFFPPMIGGILYEHGHRLIAGTVATLTVLQAVLFWRFESRSWVRKLSYGAVAVVFCQAALGGLTVILRLPTIVSVGHACLAQIFFCTIVTLTQVTSASWFAPAVPLPREGKFVLPFVCFTLSGLFFCQLLAGAIMRHSGAGLAIPDFPTVFGGFIPPFWSNGILVHFIHRMGAYTLATFTTILAVYILNRYETHLNLVSVAGGLIALVIMQVMMGAMIVWLKRPVLLTMSHLAVGALCFGTSILLTLKTFRLRYLTLPVSVEAPSRVRGILPQWEPA